MASNGANSVASAAIVVFKKNGEMGMKWQFDTRNWCVFGSHKDCDIQIRSEDAEDLQALVKLTDGQLSLETLSSNKQTVVPGYGPLNKGAKVPLNDGSHFCIAGRHFGAELIDAAAAVEPALGVISPRNPYTDELNRSAQKKGYGSSLKKRGKQSRRTSLVLTGTEQILVEATTKTELFPSSVLQTPSEDVAAMLDAVPSSSNDMQNDDEQDIAGYKIKLSYPSEEESDEETSDAESEGELEEELEESGSETHGDDEAHLALSNDNFMYISRKGGSFSIDRDTPGIKRFGPLDRNEVHKSQTGAPSVFEGTRFDDTGCPPADTGMTFTRHHKPDDQQTLTPPADDGDLSDGDRPSTSFSRWPRNKKKLVGTITPKESQVPSNVNVDDPQISRTKGSSDTISALSKKQMVFDRLSQGLPSTPMKWETGFNNSRLTTRSTKKFGTPIGSNSIQLSPFSGAELSSNTIAKTPIRGLGKENLPVGSKDASGKKSKRFNVQSGCLPPKSPAVAPRDMNLPSPCPPDGSPALASRDGTPQDPTSRVTGKQMQSGIEAPAQSRRRSVLFSDFELERGPHYSPARVQSSSGSSLGSPAESSTRGLHSHPKPSPLSKGAEDNVSSLNHVQGPPPTEKLQQLGTFFYPAQSRDVEGTANGREEMVSVGEKEKNYEANNPETSLVDANDGSQGRMDSSLKVAHDTDATSDTSRRRSLLDAVLDAAKLVTERFSMGRASSNASGDDGSSERFDFDPEDLETASESDDGPFVSDDDETPSASSTSEVNLAVDDQNINDGSGTFGDARDQDAPCKNEGLTSSPLLNVQNGDSEATRKDVVLPSSGDLVHDDFEKYRKMKFAALRRHMKTFGLDTTGKKDALLERLSNFLGPHIRSSVSIAASDDEIALEKRQGQAQDNVEEAADRGGSECIRENYQLRTVKELQQFMKKHGLDVPPRIKKAELIDLMIARGLDSNGNLVASSGSSVMDDEVSSIAKRRTPRSATLRGAEEGTHSKTGLAARTRSKDSCKSPNGQKQAAAEQGNPVRRSRRQKYTAEPSSTSQETGLALRTRRGMSVLATPSSTADMEANDEKVCAQRPSRARPSSTSTAKAPSIPDTALRRSARKRRPARN